MILAIDFDGVLHNHKRVLNGRKLGEPMPGAKETMSRLRHELGATLIVHSVWAKGGGVKAIADWMEFHDIPYNKITNEKPNADIYLDDHAIRFTSWGSFAIEVGLDRNEDSESMSSG